MSARDEFPEETVLLQYVFSASGQFWAPSTADCERLQELLIAQGTTTSSHQLDVFVLRHPIFLRPLDMLTIFFFPDSALRRKLFLAAAVMETTPASAEWLLPKNRSLLSLMTQTAQVLLRLFVTLLLAFPFVFFLRFLRRNAGVV